MRRDKYIVTPVHQRSSGGGGNRVNGSAASKQLSRSSSRVSSAAAAAAAPSSGAIVTRINVNRNQRRKSVRHKRMGGVCRVIAVHVILNHITIPGVVVL